MLDATWRSDTTSDPEACLEARPVAHMIQETARHLGHLDILREQLDRSVR